MQKWYSQYITSLKQALGSDFVYNLTDKKKSHEMDSLNVTSVGEINTVLECFYEEPTKERQGRVLIRLPKDINSALRKRIFGWYIGLHSKSSEQFNLGIEVKQDKGELIRRYRVGELRLLTGLYGDNRDDITLVINRGKVNRAAAIELVKQITYELTNEGWIGDE